MSGNLLVLCLCLAQVVFNVNGQMCDPVNLPAFQRHGLETFYNKTNGAKWLDSARWLSPAATMSECSWNGVVCSWSCPPKGPSSATIVTLRLPSNGIGGPLPGGEVWASLNGPAIWLWNNSFTGIVPRVTGFSNNYIDVSLSDNKFTSISPGALKVAKSIDFTNNLIGDSIASVVSHCNSFLDSFGFSNNRITGKLNDAVLQGLKQCSGGFDLSRNQLQGDVPPQFASATSFKNFFGSSIVDNWNISANAWTLPVPKWCGPTPGNNRCSSTLSVKQK